MLQPCIQLPKAFFLAKPAMQYFFRDFPQGAIRIDTLAGPVQAGRIQIGSQNFQNASGISGFQVMEPEQGQSERFFTAAAAYAPGPH